MVQWCLATHIMLMSQLFFLYLLHTFVQQTMVLLMVWEIVYTLVSYSFFFEKQLVFTDRGIL